jgi:hypothetical protein
VTRTYKPKPCKRCLLELLARIIGYDHSQRLARHLDGMVEA